MRKQKWLWIGLAIVLIAGVLLVNNPQIRTNLFVRMYHEDIEEGLRLEIWILTALGYSLEELSANLIVMMGLMTGFGLYFCVFTKEKLPKYYDDNRISYFSDGFLRMHFLK